MTKHRRTKRRSQKGGFWSFPSSDPNAPTQSWGDYFLSLGTKAKDTGSSLNNSIGNVASSAATSITDGANLLNPFASNESSTTPVIQPAPVVQASPSSQNMGMGQSTMNNNIDSTGGRRRKRARSMKGGKDGLGLTYYATPVSGMKVAEPTYWVNSNTNQPAVGGSRHRQSKTRKSRRTRRHKRR